MRSATRYASRKVSAGLPIYTLVLLVGLVLAVIVMMWSLHAVHHTEIYLHPRRLEEGEDIATYDPKPTTDAADNLPKNTVASTTTGSSSTSTAGSGPDQCHVDEHNEYHGDVLIWGDKNIKASAWECCESCTSTPGCNIWVYCGREEGCGSTQPHRPKGECWLKHNTLSYIMSNYGEGHSGITWTAGSLYSDAEYAEYLKQREADLQAEAERLAKLKNDPELPLVWMDVSLNGTRLGRIEMVLFVKDAPRAAENFRLLCTGELGPTSGLNKYHFAGSYFYRIIDRFIDQTGAQADGIFGGNFHDDPGGLKLKHTHKGLLSMANGGPNTNGGHFSMVMGPAHHLDGSYTIFGEIVSGIEHAEAINTLAKGQPNSELLQSKLAQIVAAGQIRPGSVVSTPEFRAIIEAEKRRVEWRRGHSMAELTRLRKLSEDQSLPMVYLDVAIKGVYAGRIEMVLFVKDAPRAAENFRLLCTGEAGVAPPGHEGAGLPYQFKGAYFYRIIDSFIDQTGVNTDSPLGGYFQDDAGGLAINHTHMGLLSMANIGPNTNGAHFSIIMAPAHHLDGHYTIFGEVVDGHNVAYEINALAKGQPNNEHSGSKDAQIIDSGEIRRGTYWASEAFQSVIATEKKRISDQRQTK
ncbi:hypothetical protein VOLCADRAFT_74454 [Volvox carteri f. nagariensis]|uniref:PPIase cyclophilin-type domain-containing protein n=1 Tax=Volvox carteri f. nagariensis TaxID=3068 RepID=D8TUD4_VOLCA|nr:uncharacterized protein VOLCADRAFT_74454 [Volvox carteri f. nagariensis]EFJ49124.1 hypothetical protein VOLCADRAFT_74454 [Volvox carteri f. nagariensis]|eukprot:XP_002950021.1 hypothetical protein VOLCADRAFT_74454 [Volvox carteri f. nagariensis]